MKIVTIVLSLCVMGALVLGLYFSAHSPLFQVEAIELSTTGGAYSPLDEGEILALASVPIGKTTLYELDLKGIQGRILSNDWIEGVTLQKRFPHTLVMQVKLREPAALFQSAKGGLSYVDSEGKTFGSITMKEIRDLPILVGFKDTPERLKSGLGLLSRWRNANLEELALISSLIWDADRGYRVLVAYPLDGLASEGMGGFHTKARAMIDLGFDFESSLDEKLGRLTTVLHYLSSKSIGVRQIWADVGKKVVVKTAHGF